VNWDTRDFCREPYLAVMTITAVVLTFLVTRTDEAVLDNEIEQLQASGRRVRIRGWHQSAH
jgi:hypothetical protein